MRVFINSAVADPEALAVILPGTCDQMRRGVDFAKTHSPKPMFLMNIPVSCETPGAFDLYGAEMKRLGRFLVSIGGDGPDDETLATVMRRFDQKRRALISGEMVLTGREFDQIFDDGEDGDSEECVPAYLQYEQKVPVAVIGAHLLPAHSEIFDILAECGGSVALNGTDSGERVVPGSFRSQKLRQEPERELLGAYLGVIPDIFQRPNHRFFAWLRKMVEQREIQGVILLRYPWCDPWHAEVARLRECCPVPFLDLQLEGERIAENVGARLQAFLEMLR
jgi:benzoyl-CoA reductase/2-hydroxyglutaryl-CoA dehydratase subunit BcrC/BadD/HgdB